MCEADDGSVSSGGARLRRGFDPQAVTSDEC